MTVKTMAARCRLTSDDRSAHPRSSNAADRRPHRRLGLLAVVLIAALFPVYFMTITAFHPPSLSFSRKPTIFSADLSLKAFRDLIRQVSLHTGCATPSSSRCAARFFGLRRDASRRTASPGFAIPGAGRSRAPSSSSTSSHRTLLFIPIFIVLNSVHLLDSLPALIAVYLTFSIPFCIWLLKAYFLGIPRELEDAAQVDGATRWQSMTRVVLPLATPGIAVACIYSFTLAWNEYLYAFTLLVRQEKFTLAPGLTKLIIGDVFLWGMIMAGGVLMSAPFLILYFLAQRFIVAGLAAGAVKR